jgi:hypothetical protein
MSDYPLWRYYPPSDRPPDWARALVGIVALAEAEVSSRKNHGLTSDTVLARLRPGLEAAGYRVEGGKTREQRIHLPVLFGDQGRERVAWEVDAVHDELGIAIEVEAGRGARGNAVYRDLVRASVLVDVRFLVLGVMLSYRHQSAGREVNVSSYAETQEVLDAIYASGRLKLPFQGLLLVGY